METRAHYVLVGAFAIGVAFALMLFTLWIARASFNQSYDVYDVVFDGPIRGLANGGEVRFQGIQVGEVTDLRLNQENPNQVIARVRIDASTPIRTSSSAQLEPLGLTGVSLVQLTAGDPEDPLVSPRGGQPPPRIIARPGQFDALLNAGEDVAGRAAAVLESVQAVLSEQNVARITRVLEDVELLTDELAQQRGVIGETRASLRQLTQTAEQIAQAADALEALSVDAKARLGGLEAETTETLQQTQRTLAAVEQTAQAGTRALNEIEDAAGVAAAETLPDLAVAVQDLRRLATALEQLADNLYESPTDFVLGSRRPVVELD